MYYEQLDLIDKLKVFQVLNGLNQTEIGRRLEVSQPYICKVMKREVKPSIKLEDKIRNLIK